MPASRAHIGMRQQARRGLVVRSSHPDFERNATGYSSSLTRYASITVLFFYQPFTPSLSSTACFGVAFGEPPLPRTDCVPFVSEVY